MTMNLHRPQSITQQQAILYNTYANKTTSLTKAQKPVSASLSKMHMIDRIQGIKSGCGSCGK